MGDFALEWDSGLADMVISDDDVLSDSGLRTAILLSLFTDRRAEDEDNLPSEDGDRRGWWGDQFAETEGDRIGSRRWLLDRAKSTEEVAMLMEEYDKEALQWMIEDRVASRVDVSVSVQGHRLDELIMIHRPEKDPTTFRFSHTWDGEQNHAVE